MRSHRHSRGKEWKILVAINKDMVECFTLHTREKIVMCSYFYDTYPCDFLHYTFAVLAISKKLHNHDERRWNIVNKYTHTYCIYKEKQIPTHIRFNETHNSKETTLMADKVTLSLLTLPIELVYRILDNLDELTILISARNVCTRLNLIIDTYHRYKVKEVTFFPWAIPSR